ncbi:dienelactone hydrolase [Colletotrichum karsti]|uniref:Dienelactone hydrolase n=1 Tax=Colletotrichum karsti TaxID=1095194 RepID=A0A9P6LFG0_9PEZI|nr:dienelactone hydrolase [Colletotrichum karsti]KAF9871141.1 dienelactone hydrolase [Colletotrichum karsti]
MAVSTCCLKAFEWDGTPTGRIERINDTDVYIAGDNPNVGILYVHDLLGWTFPNARLLADHYAREANVTVYVPDFFGGEVLAFEPLLNGRFHELDLPGFMQRNARDIREPEIFGFARTLREKHKKVGAIGFCYGGWAAFRLGAGEHQPPLVDCIAVGHPSLLTKEDIDGVSVPVQVLAPEFDVVFTAELKSHFFETAVKKAVAFEYHHFPGVEHACLVRGDPNKQGERDAMVRGKSAAVNWFQQHLQ